MQRNFMRLTYGIAASLIAAQTFVAAQASPNPPVARVAPKTDKLHGETRVDNYYWLREKTNPEVLAYLQAENAYTEAGMKHTEALQETL